MCLIPEVLCMKHLITQVFLLHFSYLLQFQPSALAFSKGLTGKESQTFSGAGSLFATFSCCKLPKGKPQSTIDFPHFEATIAVTNHLAPSCGEQHMVTVSSSCFFRGLELHLGSEAIPGLAQSAQSGLKRVVSSGFHHQHTWINHLPWPPLQREQRLSVSCLKIGDPKWNS